MQASKSPLLSLESVPGPCHQHCSLGWQWTLQDPGIRGLTTDWVRISGISSGTMTESRLLRIIVNGSAVNDAVNDDIYINQLIWTSHFTCIIRCSLDDSSLKKRLDIPNEAAHSLPGFPLRVLVSLISLDAVSDRKTLLCHIPFCLYLSQS